MIYPLFKVYMSDDAVREAAKVLKSGYIGQGDVVEEFERQFKAYIGADRDVVTVNSATSALDLAMHMCGVDRDSEVVSTPITCTATNSPAITRGATIVWAPVCEKTGLIDEDAVGALITEKTKCIIAVNWGGRKPDYNKLKTYGLPVVEDAAHGPYKLDGNNGDYIIWSFQAIKFLTTGDGGAILCPDPERARLLRWFGLNRRTSADFRAEQNIQEVGYKYHMNDISAAIGLANLKDLDKIVQVHRINATYYDRMLRGFDKPPYDVKSPYWIYTIFADREIIPYLRDKGIQASPVHSRNDAHDAFRRQSYNCDHSSSMRYNEKQINIPVGWWLSYDDVRYIAETVWGYRAYSGKK